MSDFTEQEFNEAMADLMDVHVSWGISKGRTINMVIAGNWTYGSFMPYNDLNQLMPIAWKYGIELWISDEFEKSWCAGVKSGVDFDPACENKDPAEAIRQCLWQIAKEQK